MRNLDVVAGGDDTGLVEAAVELHDDLAGSVVVDDLELADVAWEGGSMFATWSNNEGERRGKRCRPRCEREPDGRRERAVWVLGTCQSLEALKRGTGGSATSSIVVITSVVDATGIGDDA